jgi:uncharacterized protein
MFALESRDLVLLGALALGLALGAIAQASSFCVRGALIEWRRKDLAGDHRGKFFAWLLAILVAVAGSQALTLTTGLNLAASIPLAAPASLSGVILGGLLFGIGMVLAGGCISRLLVLMAAGNLRALVVLLVTATVAYATMRGLLAGPRLLLQAVELPAKRRQLGILTGIGAETAAGLAVFASLIGAIVLVTLAVRRQLPPGRIAGGAAVGALVPLGWLLTGIVGADDFDPTPIESLNFTGPIANGLLYVMTSTGTRVDFGVALIAGLLLGAGGLASARGQARLVGFETPRQLLRYLAGGVLMGFGGVLALGCTFGNGLSGVATLSIGSWLALAAIVLGAVLALRWTETGRVAQSANPLVGAGAIGLERRGC